MATQNEYDYVAAELKNFLTQEEDTNVPEWARDLVPAGTIDKAAPALAKLAIDAIDAYRAKK
jgi:hypothetical protein